MSCFLPEFAILQKKLLINLGQKVVIIHIKKFKTIIQAINQSFQKLQTFNCKVRFATISQVSLTSYINFQHKKGNLLKSIHQFEQITYQQKSFENDIIQINEEICKIGKSSIRLGKDVTKFLQNNGAEMGAIVKEFKMFNMITFMMGSIQMQGLQINGFYV